MTWQHEGNRHEGYLVALERDDERGVFAGDLPFRLRELGHRDAGRAAVSLARVACSCGWRSPVLRAPFHTSTFDGGCVAADEGWTDACGKLWKAHADAVPKMPAGDGYDVRTLVRALEQGGKRG